MDDLSILKSLFDELPIGVVLLDSGGRVVHFNRTEERLAHRKRADVVDRPFFEEIAPCMNIRELGGRFRADIGHKKLDIELEMSFPFPFLTQPRDARVRLSSFEQGGHSFGCLFVEDISAQRAVDRMKEQLSQLLVHDLKNPLSAILANLDFLIGDGGPPPAAQIGEALADARQGGIRLQRMLVNLLDVTRLQTGEFPLRRAPCDLAALLRESLARAAAVAREGRVALLGEGLDEPAPATLDADVIARAVDNLVENAVRHTRAGGQVSVSLERTADALTVHIADQGPGVPEGLRETIFEPFASLQPRQSGSSNRGLGLTFVRLAARAHGGAATIDCPASGGSVFSLRLPFAQDTSAAVRASRMDLQ